MIGELIQLAAVLGVLLCLGLVFTNLLKGAGRAGAGIGAGIGSIFAGLGAMFDGIGSGTGKAVKGGGSGVGKAAKGAGKGLGSLAKGAASGAAKMLPKAGKAAGSVLGGLGIGAAALGAGAHTAAKKSAKTVSETAKKVASSDTARSVRNAARRATANAKASLRTEAQELADDVKFGLGMETGTNGHSQYSAYGWQIDPTAADDLRSAFEEYDVRHNWHQDPETGDWYVIFPNEEIGFAQSVMDDAGFAVDGGGVPAEWYEPTDTEVYDDETGEWVPAPARGRRPDGVPLDETAFGGTDAVDADVEDVTVEGGA